MTFDEQLRRAVHTLADRLRADITQQVEAIADELSRSAQADRDQAAADARAEVERAVAARIASSVADAEARAYAYGKEEGRQEGETRDGSNREPDVAASERLVEAMRSIDHARSLSEVLDTLVSCAGREVARVAVLLVRDQQLRSWRLVGFDADLISGESLELSLDDSGIIGTAVRGNAVVSADSAEGTGAPSFARLPNGQECLAVPIAMAGQVVAVLYADQGSSRSSITWPDTVEVLTRHASRCLEALTAFAAAHALLERPDAGAVPALAHADAAVEEDAAARRYARLLVSEIKLYHETAVMAGRRERDLVARLGGEIARARVLYEQRVPAHVLRRADYFHDELLRTLANGDAALLEMKA